MATLNPVIISAARPGSVPGLRDRLGPWPGHSVLPAPESAPPPRGRATSLAVGASRAVPGTACLLVESGQGLSLTSMSACLDGAWQAHRHPAASRVLTPANGFDEAVLEVLARPTGTVYAEHVLSSGGLVRLYPAVSEVQGWTPGRPDRAVRQTGLEGSDEAAEQALAMFCALLGSLAGQLTYDPPAWGGVAKGGSVVPALGDWFASSAFRTRFDAQAMAGCELDTVPTWVMPGLASP